jgi:hypothetical protein
MFITRRSILRSIAATPAAYCLATHSLWALAPQPCTSTTSAFVILEGPWLIWQDPSTSYLKALSFGDAGHDCEISTQTCAGPSTGMGSLDGGSPGTVTATNAQAPTIKPPYTAFQTLFNTSSSANATSTDAGDNFAWVTGHGTPSVTVQPWDRTLTFNKLPTNVHTAGFLAHATVTSSGGVLALENVHSHIATILEYAPSSGANVSLALAGPTSKTITGGEHLIFRMVHAADCDESMELCHIQCAFMGLAERVSINGQNNLLQMTITTDTSYHSGQDVAGFADKELGLNPPPSVLCPPATLAKIASSRKMFSDSFANCAGGGIIVGP